MLRIETLAASPDSLRDKALILCGGILGWSASVLAEASFKSLAVGLQGMLKAKTLEKGLHDQAFGLLGRLKASLGVTSNDALAFQSASPRSKGKALERTSIFKIIQKAAWAIGVGRGGIGLLRVLARLRRELVLAQSHQSQAAQKWESWAQGILNASWAKKMLAEIQVLVEDPFPDIA